MDAWTIVGAVATAITALTALVAAWMALGQLRLLVRQSQLGQQLAYAQATRDSMIHQQSVLDHFMAFPELRRYVFDGAVPPADDKELCERVAVMADMQLELHECSLEMSTGLSEFSVNYLDWRTSARWLWSGSSAIREAACAAPSIYDDFLRAVHSEDPALPPSSSDAPLAARIMASSLGADPLWGPTVSSRVPWRWVAIRVLMVRDIKAAARQGWFRVTDDQAGMGAWFAPGPVPPILSGREKLLVRIAFGRDGRQMCSLFNRMSNMRAALGPHLYGEFLGVLEESRMQGVARSIGDEGLDWAKRAAVPVYLETFTESNREMYEKFGFRVVAHFNAPRGIRGYGMLRDFLPDLPAECDREAVRD